MILQRAALMSGVAQVALTITLFVVRGACVLCPFFLSEKLAKKDLILQSGNLPLASLSPPARSHRGCAATMQMALQVPTGSTAAQGGLVEKGEAAAPVSGVLKKTPNPLPCSSSVSVTSQAFDFSCCWSLCRGEMGCKVIFGPKKQLWSGSEPLQGAVPWLCCGSWFPNFHWVKGF